MTMNKTGLAAFAALLFCSGAASGQEERPPQIDRTAAEAIVGSYDAVLRVSPSGCTSTDGFAGEWQSTMDIAQGNNGILLRLEQMKSFFRQPVDVQLDGGGFSYRGPVRVYLRPYYPTVHFDMTGAFDPDTRALTVLMNGTHEGCPITGELKGTWTSRDLKVPSAPPPDRSTGREADPLPAAQAAPAADPTAGRTLGKRKKPGAPGSSFGALLNSESSFQTFNFPDRYIRHAFWLGVVEPSGGNFGSIIFRTVSGLGGRCISLESKDQSGHFLRHQDRRIRLSKLENDGTMRADSTFCIVPGLASSTGISFEAASAPGHYLRHRNFELWIDRPDGSDQFRKDATFLAAPPGGATPGVR
jgi:hypothetical protein